MFMESQTRAWLNQNVSEEPPRHLNILLLVFTYVHCWLIYYSKALCVAGLQASSGTVFVNALPRWNISETRLASVFTSRGLALEIAQSKDVRAGSYSWEIICKGHVPPSPVVLNVFLPASGSLPSSKLKWGKYMFLKYSSVYLLLPFCLQNCLLIS